GVVAAGAAGVNLEDARHDGVVPLLPIQAQVERLAAARAAAGGGLYVNARTDVYLLEVGDPAGRLDTALERAAAYLAAGADGVFVPGVTDADTISRLVEGIAGPVNILAGPGAPSVAELADLGVARISV